jgi:dihydropteroate synthase
MLLRLGEHTIDCTHHTAVMGILNVSYDSPIAESRVDVSRALDRAVELRQAGAEIIDIGAHSTRAEARDVSPQEEIERVCPVIEAVAGEGIATSVDTWTPEVARAAAEAGVHLLNDVSAFAAPEMVAVAVEYGLAACVMHMRGAPKHHYDVDQTYDDIVAEVHDFLEARATVLEAAGVSEVWLDPGFAFGKPADDNLRLLDGLPELVALGRPVLISASRKGFLGELLGEGYDQYAPRILEATLSFNTLAAWLGVHVVRVHDVEPVVAALRVVDAVRAHARADA